MKKACYLLFALVLGMLASNIALAAGKGPALLGTWVLTDSPTDASGKPCPFIPQKMQFFKDHTLTMSTIPNRSLPYKTDPTPDEREKIEARDPDLKGKQLLLIKPNPNLDWVSTPMVYGYSLKGDRLTLSIKGWEPSTFKRKK